MSDPNGNDVDTGNLIEYEILATEANGQYRVDGKYEATSKVSAANFCFNKGLCMIWNEGSLSKDKSFQSHVMTLAFSLQTDMNQIF